MQSSPNWEFFNLINPRPNLLPTPPTDVPPCPWSSKCQHTVYIVVIQLDISQKLNKNRQTKTQKLEEER